MAVSDEEVDTGLEPLPPELDIVIGELPIAVKDVHEVEPEQVTDVVATPCKTVGP